jgi:hypothetical protein
VLNGSWTNGFKKGSMLSAEKVVGGRGGHFLIVGISTGGGGHLSRQHGRFEDRGITLWQSGSRSTLTERSQLWALQPRDQRHLLQVY